MVECVSKTGHALRRTDCNGALFCTSVSIILWEANGLEMPLGKQEMEANCYAREFLEFYVRLVPPRMHFLSLDYAREIR